MDFFDESVHSSSSQGLWLADRASVLKQIGEEVQEGPYSIMTSIQLNDGQHESCISCQRLDRYHLIEISTIGSFWTKEPTAYGLMIGSRKDLKTITLTHLAGRTPSGNDSDLRKHVWMSSHDMMVHLASRGQA